MCSARTLRAVVSALLLAAGATTAAAQGFWPVPEQSGTYGTHPQWAGSAQATEPTVADGRYNPWTAVGPASAPGTSAAATRNELGQRTWNVLQGDSAMPPTPPAERPQAPQPVPSAAFGFGFGPSALYGGGAYMYGGYGMPYPGIYGSAYPYGLPGYGTGFPSPLGLGGMTPWALPW